ncbi:Protein CBG27967 [Caenorhabditis briggsae]|uniref:Protein CBG27967 n=1 Tax=Caenorhabditis briggsae TaxID=6238 RepID=B6IJQ9_CAEBR|nr:Protein CBG27967 [Caenorhabditis briggsae]CAS00139.1 Protein CBG27967 [Caenorhabditis briggsae]
MDNIVHQPRNMPDNELADPEVPQEVMLFFREIKMIGEMLYVIGCEPRSHNGRYRQPLQTILAALSSPGST